MTQFATPLMPMSPNGEERTMFITDDDTKGEASVTIERVGYELRLNISSQQAPASTITMARHIADRLRFNSENTMVGNMAVSSYGTTWQSSGTTITCSDSVTSTYIPTSTAINTSIVYDMSDWMVDGTDGTSVTGHFYTPWLNLESAVCEGVSNFYKVDGWRFAPDVRLREIIRSRKAPGIIIRQNDRRRPLPMPQDVRERRARETMRRVLGSNEYRRFVTHGFVSVKGKSGLVYQIFTGHGITCVYDQGQMVERLCVVLRGNFCPTDSLMMRYLMILNDEAQFRSLAIKHNVTKPVHTQIERPEEDRSLVEIFRELKGQEKKAVA